jgi:hypothetical protein
MPANTNTGVSNFFKSITLKDIVLIIGLLASTIGWLRSATVKSLDKDHKIEVLTTVIQQQTHELEKINDILTEQQLLNGKIIQYMQMQ